MCWRLSVAAATLACLSASPVAAANPGDYFPAHSQQTRVGAYVGATISLLRTSRDSIGPSLRLGIGSRQQSSPVATELIGAPRTSVTELDLTASRRPQFYLGGRNLSAAEGSGGWGTGEVMLAIAGAAGAILLVTAVAGSDDDDDDEQCMIEPELCD
jgi:hypothetical protein